MYNVYISFLQITHCYNRQDKVEMDQWEALSILFILAFIGVLFVCGVYVPAEFFVGFYYFMVFCWVMICLAFCCYFCIVHLH
jgi:hypothetical protein